MKIYQPTPQLKSKVKMLEKPWLSVGTWSHASPHLPVPNPGCAQHPSRLPPISLPPPPPRGLCVAMDRTLLSPATPGAAQSRPCCANKCSVPGDPGAKKGSPQQCGAGGSLPGGGPQGGEPAGEAASQAPGPVLLTFSHPTPPRSCLHFRPCAAGSAKRLGLALPARSRTPGTPPALPPPPKVNREGLVARGSPSALLQDSCKMHHPWECNPTPADPVQPSMPQFPQQLDDAMGQEY